MVPLDAADFLWFSAASFSMTELISVTRLADSSAVRLVEASVNLKLDSSASSFFCRFFEC
jgi:hypothetical protein